MSRRSCSTAPLGAPITESCVRPGGSRRWRSSRSSPPAFRSVGWRPSWRTPLDATAWTAPVRPPLCTVAQAASGAVSGCLLDGPDGQPEARGWSRPPFPDASGATPFVAVGPGASGEIVRRIQAALVRQERADGAGRQLRRRHAGVGDDLPATVRAPATGAVDTATAVRARRLHRRRRAAGRVDAARARVERRGGAQRAGGPERARQRARDRRRVRAGDRGRGDRLPERQRPAGDRRRGFGHGRPARRARLHRRVPGRLVVVGLGVQQLLRAPRLGGAAHVERRQDRTRLRRRGSSPSPPPSRCSRGSSATSSPVATRSRTSARTRSGARPTAARTARA